MLVCALVSDFTCPALAAPLRSLPPPPDIRFLYNQNRTSQPDEANCSRFAYPHQPIQKQSPGESTRSGMCRSIWPSSDPHLPLRRSRSEEKRDHAEMEGEKEQHGGRRARGRGGLRGERRVVLFSLRVSPPAHPKIVARRVDPIRDV